MFPQRSLKRVGPVVFLLAVAPLACTRPKLPSPGPASQSQDGEFWVTGWTYYLRPIQPAAATDAGKAKEVWRSLTAGMSKDAKTRELLTRLHGGWPAELVLVDAKNAKDQSVFKAEPAEGVAVVLRLADLNLKDVQTKTGPVPFREIAFGRVIRIKDAIVATPGVADKGAPPGRALDLAIEEYVLRHAPGWVARRGTGPDVNFDDDQQLAHSADNATLPASVEDQTRELDKRIKQYEDRAKAGLRSGAQAVTSEEAGSLQRLRGGRRPQSATRVA